MGQSKIFYITDENWDFLKNIPQRSKLINELLEQYDKSRKFDGWSEKALLERKELIKQKREIDKKLQENERNQ